MMTTIRRWRKHKTFVHQFCHWKDVKLSNKRLNTNPHHQRDTTTCNRPWRRKRKSVNRFCSFLLMENSSLNWIEGKGKTWEKVEIKRAGPKNNRWIKLGNILIFRLTLSQSNGSKKFVLCDWCDPCSRFQIHPDQKNNIWINGYNAVLITPPPIKTCHKQPILRSYFFFSPKNISSCNTNKPLNIGRFVWRFHVCYREA